MGDANGDAHANIDTTTDAVAQDEQRRHELESKEAEDRRLRSAATTVTPTAVAEPSSAQGTFHLSLSFTITTSSRFTVYLRTD